MKKLIAITLVLVAVLAMFTGCGKKKETLKVAISPDFAPMEFVDPSKSGQDMFVGFDVSLAKFIADELDMELEIVPLDFDACQIAVGSGRVDMSISGYSWTEERAEKYNMSDYYYAGENETEQVLITLASNGKKFKDAASIEGLKVGAQNASLQESLCKAQLPNAELITYTSIDTGVLQLKKGDFDVMAVAIGNANVLIANNPELAMSGFQFEVSEAEENNLILLPKGDDEMTAKVNEILAKALAAGYYETWYDEAMNTAGVEISYDADGNPIVKDEPAGDEEVGDETTNNETADNETAADATADTTNGDGVTK